MCVKDDDVNHFVAHMQQVRVRGRTKLPIIKREAGDCDGDGDGDGDVDVDVEMDHYR